MRSLQIFIAAVLVACCIGSAGAQVDRSEKPAAGPLPKSAVQPFNMIQLKNGLRVVVVEEHKQPIVYFRTLVLSGNAQDGNMNGAAAAVAELLEKGTTKMSADDIAKKLDYYGSALGSSSSVDDINVTISCLKRDLDKVLPIYSDVLQNPSFPANELEKYKSQQLSSLKAARQSPGELGRKMGRRLTYGMHPYGYYQTDSTVKALSVAALKEWHSKNFVAANTIIAVVGDISEKDVKPMMEKYFGSWKTGAAIKPQYPSVAETQGMTISLIDRPGSAQSTIRLQRVGLPATNPQFDEASLVMSIFAGNGQIGFQNRLFQNIREKHGYTYTPGGSMTRSIDPGVIVAVSEVRNSVTDSALDQMLIEYRRLANEKISDQELNFAKGLIAGKFMMDLADPQTTSALALSTIEYNLPKDYYATYPERISKFTPEQLQSVARRVFSPNDINIIVIGDAAQILPKLQRFGKVNIYDLDLNPKKNIEKKMGATTKTLDDVINKMYAGLNKPEYEKIKTTRVKAMLTLDIGGGPTKSSYEEVKEAPNKKYSKLNIGGLIVETRVDGTNVYTYAPGQAGPADPETTKQELNDAAFHEELRLKDPGYSATVLGVGMAAAGPAYVLEVHKPNGMKENWFIDTTTGYITRKEMMVGDAASSEDHSNFKVVDGIPYPFTIITHGAGDHTVEVTSIEHNIAVDENMFMKK